MPHLTAIRHFRFARSIHSRYLCIFGCVRAATELSCESNTIHVHNTQVSEPSTATRMEQIDQPQIDAERRLWPYWLRIESWYEFLSFHYYSNHWFVIGRICHSSMFHSYH